MWLYLCLCIRKMLCICKMLCNGDMIRCSGWWMLIVGAKLTCQICFNLCQPRTLHDGLRFYSSHTNTNTNRNTNMWSHDHSFYSSSLPLIYTSTISSALRFDQYSHLDFSFVLISIKVRNGRIERPCCLSSTLGGSKEWTNYMSLLSNADNTRNWQISDKAMLGWWNCTFPTLLFVYLASKIWDDY